MFTTRPAETQKTAESARSTPSCQPSRLRRARLSLRSSALHPTRHTVGAPHVAPALPARHEPRKSAESARTVAAQLIALANLTSRKTRKSAESATSSQRTIKISAETARSATAAPPVAPRHAHTPTLTVGARPASPALPLARNLEYRQKRQDFLPLLTHHRRQSPTLIVGARPASPTLPHPTDRRNPTETATAFPHPIQNHLTRDKNLKYRQKRHYL